MLRDSRVSIYVEIYGCAVHAKKLDYPAPFKMLNKLQPNAIHSHNVLHLIKKLQLVFFFDHWRVAPFASVYIYVGGCDSNSQNVLNVKFKFKLKLLYLGPFYLLFSVSNNL